MLCLSGSVASIMTSTCDWASLSSTVPVWMRGGKMDGRMVPATEAGKSGAGGIEFIFSRQKTCFSGASKACFTEVFQTCSCLTIKIQNHFLITIL